MGETPAVGSTRREGVKSLLGPRNIAMIRISTNNQSKGKMQALELPGVWSLEHCQASSLLGKLVR